MSGLPALAAREELPSQTRGASVSTVIGFTPLDLPGFLVRSSSRRWLQPAKTSPAARSQRPRSAGRRLDFPALWSQTPGQWPAMAAAESQRSTPQTSYADIETPRSDALRTQQSPDNHHDSTPKPRNRASSCRRLDCLWTNATTSTDGAGGDGPSWRTHRYTRRWSARG